MNPNYPLINTKFQAFDANGNPLAGGLVYTYEAGTTTPKSTTNTSGAYNTNPVVLDINGQADIYLNGLYKINVTDSAGVQLPGWPKDNVQGLGYYTNLSPGVYLSSFSSIQAAITTIGSTSATLIIDTTETIPADTNVYSPPNISYQFLNSGFIDGVSNSVLQINGDIFKGTVQNFGPNITISGNYNFPNVGSVGTISYLRSNCPYINGFMVYVSGYRASSDGGQGFFTWNSTSTATDNGGTVFAVSGVPTGRWIRAIPVIMDGGTSALSTGGGVDYVTPSMFGAIPGLSDSATIAINTTAFTAALETRLPLYIPAGKWYVNEINPGTTWVQNGWIKGAGRFNTTIQGATGSNIFKLPSAYSLHISDITFSGGVNAIDFQTNNVDMANITIDNCNFRYQTGISVYADSGTNSTHLSILHCDFVGNSQFVNSGTDYTLIENCWAYPTAQNFVFTTSGNITLRNLIGVPSDTSNISTSAWVNCAHDVTLENNRFGGEGGFGRCVLYYNYSPYQNTNTVTIKNNLVNTTDYEYRFYSLPSNIVIKDNYGYGLLGGLDKGILLGPGIDITLSPIVNLDIEDNVGFSFAADIQNNTVNGFINLLKKTNNHEIISDNIPLAKYLQGGYLKNIFGVNIVSTGIIVSASATYPYCGNYTTTSLTSTSSTATFTAQRNDAVTNAISNGLIVTYVLDFYVNSSTGNPIDIFLSMGNMRCRKQLVSGLNIISIPGIVNTSNPNWSIAILGIANTDSILMGRFRIFTGGYTSSGAETIFKDGSGATIAADSTHQYDIGDMINYTNPVACIGKICTTAGTTTPVFKPYGYIY